MRARVRYRVLFALVVALSLVDLVAAVWVFFTFRKPVVNNITVEQPQPLDPELLAALTNIPKRVTSPAPAAVSAVPELPGSRRIVQASVGRAAWAYGVCQGRDYAYLAGVPRFVGDRSAWGVITEIYPERIYFANGNYIENTRTERGLYGIDEGNNRADP